LGRGWIEVLKGGSVMKFLNSHVEHMRISQNNAKKIAFELSQTPKESNGISEKLNHENSLEKNCK
jgi:hypothetical protein